MSALVALSSKLAATLNVGTDGSELLSVLKSTAFKGQVSDAQMTALLIVAKHVRISESGCWEWTGALSNGYGQLTFDGKHQTAHRFALERFVEPIIDGMWVLHHCDNRICVNPVHLYQGTPVDNRRDMLKRERWSHPWGKRTNCSKGHDYETGGFYLAKKDGSRVCRTCQREAKREQRAAQKEVV